MKNILNKMDITELRNKINEIDKSMATLYEKRMEVAKEIALFKAHNNLPILDSKREEVVIANNVVNIQNPELKDLFVNFLKELMNESKIYQSRLISESAKYQTIHMHLGSNSYDILIGNNILNEINKLINLENKILLISDDLIPNQYIDKFISKFNNVYVYRFAHGENHKNIATYSDIINFLSKNGFARNDSIVALGGGLTSDIAGYVAATYMRGISFYNIPTTLLADVDASIGGKVAINGNNFEKNLIGAFYQPKKVIIDVNLLSSLDDRLFFEGLVEAIKMSITSDKELFDYVDSFNSRKEIEPHLVEIIYRALLIKQKVVELDEKEQGIRRILNFGHTIGHAIELNSELYHGECVGIGMTYFASDNVKEKIINILKKFNLPYRDDFTCEQLLKNIKHDKKKIDDQNITICYVEEIGKYQLKKMNFYEIEEIIRRLKNEK